MDTTIKSKIANAVQKLEEVIKNYPECRADVAEDYLYRNEIRPYPLSAIDPTFYEIPADLQELRNKKPKELTVEERLLEWILFMTLPAQMLNPVQPTVFTGRGPGTLAASFGVALDPDKDFQPSNYRSIDDLLADGMPDPENSGIIPEIRKQIDASLALTPDWIGIAPPDTQGPFNIAHMVLGDDAFLLPMLEPEKFYGFMKIITDFYIAFYENLRKWIGEKRYTKLANNRCRLRECSVNLISVEMYEEHVLPHDLRIAAYFGELCIHPCSGRHVFLATMKNLPNIIYNEAIPYENGIAGSISYEEAKQEIGDKPMRLVVKRTISFDEAKATIMSDFETTRSHPGFIYNYEITGMTEKNKDDLIELHRWMNAYWRENIWNR